MVANHYYCNIYGKFFGYSRLLKGARCSLHSVQTHGTMPKSNWSAVAKLLFGRVVMKNVFARFVKEESGATAIEYGLIAALLSVAIIGTLQAVGGSLDATYQAIQAAIAGA